MRGAVPVLIFDGRCGFCTRSVEWLLKRARQPIRALPYQALNLQQFGLTEAQARHQAWWIDSDGTAPQGGHRAVGHCLLRCGPGWRLLGRAILAPPLSWPAAAGYRLVARLRRHLPGSTPACRRAWDMDAGRPAS